MKECKENGGISLIVLVITIIVVIILASAVIVSLVNNNPITSASEARIKSDVSNMQAIFTNAVSKVMAESQDVIEITAGPLNTVTSGEKSAVGNAVYKLSDGTNGEVIFDTLPNEGLKYYTGKRLPIYNKKTTWYVDEDGIISLEVGDKKYGEGQIGIKASVTVVAIGNGETVPVPIGFYYVGGTISTGVVISDNPADKNKYVNYTPTGEVKEGIPSGVAYNEDGTVNIENSELKGNQFVWIPVSANEYVKKDWGMANATWERQTNTAELPQIQKYGGFYVGRYEAGTSNINLSTGINFASQNTAYNWANDSFSIRDGLNHTVTGKINLKAGEIPYYHADYETALKLSNSMYQTEYVQSGLITGTMWDAMMKFIAGNDDTVVTSSTWGNYTNGNVTYTEGKGRYATVDSNNGTMTSAFTKSNGNYNYGIKTTAISEDVKKKNLYDVAGNLLEWTQEASYPNNTVESYMLRGGSFSGSYAGNSTCCRANSTAANTSTVNGFRPALYIK